jgi:hypothetical protein
MPTPQADLLTHLDALTAKVEGFREHLEIAKNFSDDSRVTAFIAHTLDEEAERLTKLAEIRQQLSRQQPVGLASSPVAEAHHAVDLPDNGHYKLRDQRELTVGSLLNVQ